MPTNLLAEMYNGATSELNESYAQIKKAVDDTIAVDIAKWFEQIGINPDTVKLALSNRALKSQVLNSLSGFVKAKLGFESADEEKGELKEGEREAEELELYIVNDGETYRSMNVSKLAKDLQNGSLSGDAAVKAFRKVVDYGARRYDREFPPGEDREVKAFSKADKEATVKGLITYYSEP